MQGQENQRMQTKIIEVESERAKNDQAEARIEDEEKQQLERGRQEKEHFRSAWEAQQQMQKEAVKVERTF